MTSSVWYHIFYWWVAVNALGIAGILIYKILKKVGMNLLELEEAQCPYYVGSVSNGIKCEPYYNHHTPHKERMLTKNVSKYEDHYCGSEDGWKACPWARYLNAEKYEEEEE